MENTSINLATSFNTAIIDAAKQSIVGAYNQKHDARYVYHNYNRIESIVQLVKQIGAAQDVDEDTMEMILLASWFCEVGYLSSYSDPTTNSKALAKAFLIENKYPLDKIDRVLNIIQSTGENSLPVSIADQILSDAITGHSFTDKFSDDYALLRLEWELIQNQPLSNYKWNQIQLQSLLQSKFFTAYGKSNFVPALAQNIKLQKEKVSKNNLNQNQLVPNEDGSLRKYQRLGRGNTGGAMQTFFRTNYRNHINLSAIADNKANIMISVNAILISVMISILSYRNLSQTQPMVLLPVVIFLVTGLTSLIFAVLSIRPKITSINSNSTDMEEAKKNVVFFGNFIQLDLEQYEEAMDAVLRNSELLYGNMVRDLYYLGLVLDKKYRYLTMAYNIFMLGFVATVITFLIAIFM